MVHRMLSRISSFLSTGVRFDRGRDSKRQTLPPRVDIELYDFEACPFCRLVREAVTELDLDVKIYPCPKGGRRYREKAMAYGGKIQFPLMIDRTRGIRLYESASIIAYLHGQYGAGESNIPARNRKLEIFLSSLCSILRGAAGTFVKRSVEFESLPVFYGAEGCWKSRLVREELCVREIAYQSVSVGCRSSKRTFLEEISDGRGIPVLIVPQAGKLMRGTTDILSFLKGLNHSVLQSPRS